MVAIQRMSFFEQTSQIERTSQKMQLIKKILPRGKKQFLANVLDCTGANRLLRHFGSWSGLIVMNYHRIGNPQDCPFDRNLFSASQENLEKQIQKFQSQCDLIGVDDLETALKSPRGKHVLLTFDDGYRDNYELAFPVLKSCSATALFFIATDYIDHPRVAWWDEIAWIIRSASVSTLPAGKWFNEPITIAKEYPAQAIGQAVRKYWSLQEEETESFLNDLAESTQTGRADGSLAENLWMSWDMIQEMHEASMRFGGHTVTHPVLSQISTARQQEEIHGCTERLKEKLGVAPQAFGYPVGQSHMFTSKTKQIVEEAGYCWAFSFYGNHCKVLHQDLFDIPRCAIEYGLSPAILNSRLTIPQIFAKN